MGDFFCGSGTTLVAAANLDRRFIGCDLGRLAIHTAAKRLAVMPPKRFALIHDDWLQVDVSFKRDQGEITLIHPTTWPSHPELDLDNHEWIDAWSLGTMGPSGFRQKWAAVRRHGTLTTTSCLQGEQVTHALVWDVLGRGALMPLITPV